jgi:hypothetical protein
MAEFMKKVRRTRIRELRLRTGERAVCHECTEASAGPTCYARRSPNTPYGDNGNTSALAIKGFAKKVLGICLSLGRLEPRGSKRPKGSLLAPIAMVSGRVLCGPQTEVV